MARADATPGEVGLQAALDEAARVIAADPGAGKHGLMMFITHHRMGSQLPIPALEDRFPQLVVGAALATKVPPDAADPEARLDWFRTDPLANQHHEHWHVVYPHEGIPGPAGHAVLQDRQGEIFLYMHQQMLARYDAERLATGLCKVEPFADYRATIVEGYDPHLDGYVARPPGSHLVDIVLPGPAGPVVYPLSTHEGLRDLLSQAVSANAFSDGTTVEIDSLGATIESTIGSHARSLYGQLHNLGHVLFAKLTSPEGAAIGVMWSTATAIRDPIFYQWHRHVDDFGFHWQEGRPPLSFDDAPPVHLRAAADGMSEDLAVCEVADVPGGPDQQFDWAAWGQTTFGGDAWNRAATDVAPATKELHTHFATRIAAGQQLAYLDHSDFVYVIRADNQRAEPTDVTVRIFLAPESAIEDRRTWIEMDKFHQQLPAGRTVIVRPNRLSSVIQKPAVRPPQPHRNPGTDAAVNYCNCGWPFHLLLPKGTTDGMPCRLFVMLTDWNVDQTAPDTHCGSMSFCGARDARYPDTRPMGYPFVRPFPNGTTATLAGLQNAGLQTIVIRHDARA